MSDKPKADVRRAQEAIALNETLVDSDPSMFVVAGGEEGPYTLIVTRLSLKAVKRTIDAINREFLTQDENP